jgi:hypothetical protein
LTQAGYYQLRLASGREDQIGVNPDPRESNLDVIPDDALALWQGKGGQTSQVASAAGNPANSAPPHKVPESLWWYLMLLMLAAVVAESFVASRYLGIQREEAEPNS